LGPPIKVSSTSTVPGRRSRSGRTMAPQFLQPSPGSAVAAQSQQTLQPQRGYPLLLIGHVPHRLKPRPQGFRGILEECPGSERSFEVTLRTAKEHASHLQRRPIPRASEDETYTFDSRSQWQTNHETPGSFSDIPRYPGALHLVSMGLECTPQSPNSQRHDFRKNPDWVAVFQLHRSRARSSD